MIDVTAAPGASPSGFPRGDSALAALVRQFDWSSTGLGPISGWPQSLKTATDIVLQAPLPLVMLWGPDGVMIYNDAYAVFAGQRHPALLGSKVLEGWPEVADFNAHVMAVCYGQGGTLSFRDRELVLNRRDAPEQLWVDLNYEPVLDESGRPAGVLAIVVETTDKVKAEEALAAERAAVIEANKRLTSESAFLRELFAQAPSFIAILTGPDHVFALTNHAYQRLIGERNVQGLPIREALPELMGQGFFELLDRVRATGEPFVGSGGLVRLRRDDGAMESRYLDFVYQPITDAQGQVTGIFVEGQDVTERMRGEQHLRLMVNELNHRVKNTLAMMQAVAAQTFRNAEDLPQAQAAFSARIMAFAKANDLLTGQNWEGASLGDVLAISAQTHAGNEPGRFVSHGPVVRLSPKTALALSMAMHELATNAVKYGALSAPGGRVLATWTVEDAPGQGERLKLEWREEGGPPVSPPARRGFGSRLVERGLAAELGGTVEVLFEPAGVVCRIDAPLDLYEEEAQA